MVGLLPELGGQEVLPFLVTAWAAENKKIPSVCLVETGDREPSRRPRIERISPSG
jgi:hypothetical protein